MSISLRTKYLSIKKEKLSETAKGLLKSMYEATDGFKEPKATKKLKLKFEAFYEKLVKSKPEAIKGQKPKESSSASSFKEARERRQAQAGVPKGEPDIKKDAGRPAIDTKGKRVTDGTHYPYKKGNVYYEYRDNRYDKRPAKYPKLEDGGMMAKGGKTKKGDVGKSGTQYGYTLKEYEEMGEKNGLFVSPKEWWSSREGKKYTDSFGRTKTIGSNSQDERQEMQSYGYRIAIGMDLGSDKIPKSAKEYVIENNLTKEEQKYAHGGHVQGYDDREDERLSMEHGKMADKYLDSTHARRDDAQFEERMDDGGMMAKGGEVYGDYKIKIEKKLSPYNKNYKGLEVKVDKDGVPLKYVLQALVDYKDKAYLQEAFDDKNVQVFTKMGARYVPLGMISKESYNKYVDFIGGGISNESGKKMMADGGIMDEPKYDSAGFSREDDKRIKIYSGNKGKLNEIFNEYKNQKNELRANEVFDNEKMKGKSVFLFVNDDFYDQYVQYEDEESYADENFGFAKGGMMADGGNLDGYKDLSNVNSSKIEVSETMANGSPDKLILKYDGKKIGQFYFNTRGYNVDFSLKNEEGKSYPFGGDKSKSIQVSNFKKALKEGYTHVKFYDEYANGGMSQGYDDREDERLGMEHGRMSSKDLNSTHARRDDAQFEERMAKGGEFATKWDSFREAEDNTSKFWNSWDENKRSRFLSERDKEIKYLSRLYKQKYENKWSKNEFDELPSYLQEILGSHVYYYEEPNKMAKGGMSQGYDDREDERLSMEHGKISSKDLDSTHARRDDAQFEERMAKGGETHRSQGGDLFAEGGETDNGNVEMVMSNTKAIQHHAEELKKLVDAGTPIEAWVVAKLERAETDLSDVTHYIDGLKKYADGGELDGHNVEIYYTGKNKVADPYTIVIDGSVYSMSGTSGPKSVNMYAGEIDEFEPQAVKGWGKKINFVNAEPELIKQIESRFEEYANGGKLVGKQKNLDVNKNGKLDAEDFKMLRKGKMAEGGKVGKNAQEIWDNLNFTTRAKVLQHLYMGEDGDNAQIYEYYNSINELSYSDWDKLPKNIKIEIENFTKGGYMAKGGKVGVKEYKIYPMKPTGVKGMITDDYDNMETFVGTEDEAVARAKEIANSNPNFVRVEVKLRLKTKTNTVAIVNGQNIQFAKGGMMAKGGELMSDDGDVPYKTIKKMQKIKVNELNRYMPSHKYIWYDNNSKKFYFKDHYGRIMELNNKGTLDELDRFIKKNNISLEQDKMAKGGKLTSKAKYIPKYQIEEVEVDINGKEKEIDGADLLDGLYVKKAAYYKKSPVKKAKGGEVKPKSNRKGGKSVGQIAALAKTIRKEGEKWTDAIKRAAAQLKKA